MKFRAPAQPAAHQYCANMAVIEDFHTKGIHSSGALACVRLGWRHLTSGGQFLAACVEKTTYTECLVLSNKCEVTSLVDHGLLSPSKACPVSMWNWLKNERCGGQQPMRAMHWHARLLKTPKPANQRMFHHGSSRGLLYTQRNTSHACRSIGVRTIQERCPWRLPFKK